MMRMMRESQDLQQSINFSAAPDSASRAASGAQGSPGGGLALFGTFTPLLTAGAAHKRHASYSAPAPPSWLRYCATGSCTWQLQRHVYMPPHLKPFATPWPLLDRRRRFPPVCPAVSTLRSFKLPMSGGHPTGADSAAGDSPEAPYPEPSASPRTLPESRRKTNGSPPRTEESGAHAAHRWVCKGAGWGKCSFAHAVGARCDAYGC